MNKTYDFFLGGAVTVGCVLSSVRKSEHPQFAGCVS